MTAPLESLFNFPEGKLSREEKVAWLEPFIRGGFRQGFSENGLLEMIKGSNVSMRRQDFLKLATPIYEEMRQATAVSLKDDSERMNITDLLKKNANLEDRFWARVRFDYTLPNGQTDSKYLTYGFEEMESIGDLKADAMSVMAGDSIDIQVVFDTIEIEEMYRRY